MPEGGDTMQTFEWDLGETADDREYPVLLSNVY